MDLLRLPLPNYRNLHYQIRHVFFLLNHTSINLTPLTSLLRLTDTHDAKKGTTLSVSLNKDQGHL